MTREKAASYSAEQATNYTAYQKQQDETQRQQQDADAKNNAVLAEQQAATNRTQALQTRYGELQKQEDDLLRQIGEAKQPGPEYRQGKSVRHQPNPQKSQLPLLQSHLKRCSSRKRRSQEAVGQSAALGQHEDAISRELVGTARRTVRIIADASPHRLIVSDPHLHTTP